MKKVFLTGATGFIGSEILKLLLDKKYEVTVLARDESRIRSEHPALRVIKGDILKPETYSDAMQGLDAVIHLVGIIREYPGKGVTFENMHHKATVNIVDCALKNGIERFVHMSANGTREDAVSDYHKTKYSAELYVKKSGLTYTILRPSVVYGPGDMFINMLNNFMKLTPVFSYFGSGGYRMQPVSVYEVAEIFVNSLVNSKSFNKTYTVCGKNVLTYKDILKLIMEVTGRKRILFPIPEPVIKVLVDLFGKTTWFPITTDQFTMLLEGNVCNNSDAFKDMNVQMRNIEDVLREYLK